MSDELAYAPSFHKRRRKQRRRSVDYFGQITHPSPSLRRIAAYIAARLGGEGGQAAAAKPVWRFDQGMGGGKSHALVALWHMATDPAGFAGTDVGDEIMAEATRLVGSGTIDPSLGDPIVVALPGDQMDPDRPDPDIFGGAQTLRERFLFRLYGGDHDRWVATKDTISYQDALRSVERPVLVLFDEVMHYVRDSTAAGPAERGRQRPVVPHRHHATHQRSPALRGGHGDDRLGQGPHRPVGLRPAVP